MELRVSRHFSVFLCGKRLITLPFCFFRWFDLISYLVNHVTWTGVGWFYLRIYISMVLIFHVAFEFLDRLCLSIRFRICYVFLQVWLALVVVSSFLPIRNSV